MPALTPSLPQTASSRRTPPAAASTTGSARKPVARPNCKQGSARKVAIAVAAGRPTDAVVSVDSASPASATVKVWRSRTSAAGKAVSVVYQVMKSFFGFPLVFGILCLRVVSFGRSLQI